MESMKNAHKSMTLQGLAINVLVFITQTFNVNVAPDKIQSVVAAVATVIGFGMVLYGRYRKGDLFVKK